jgi:4-amino-4-deoxy-L-arabinose transferase-like glycosyltransferase
LLTKGPVALVLTAGPLLLFAFLDSRAASPSWKGWALYLAGALAVAGPWFVAVSLQEERFAGYFFWRHNVVRYLAPFDHAKPAWYYLPALAVGLLPWALLLPGFAFFLARRRGGRRRPAALGFFLLCAGVGLLFFSASGCKRPTYILPILPPLALALGCYLDSRLPRRGGWRALLSRGAPLASDGAALSLTMGLGLTLLAAGRGLIPAPAGGLLVGLMSLGLFVLLTRRKAVSWAACALATAGALTAGVWVLLPGYNTQYALREPLEQYAGRSGGAGLPVFCYPQRWDSVSFYLPGAAVRAYSREQRHQMFLDLREHPQALLLVKTGQPLEELLAELPASVEVVARRRSGSVTIARVRTRPEAPAGLLAAR